MPGLVRPVNDERDGLLQFLAQQRDGIKVTAFGLTDDEARLTPSASVLSVGGLIKHAMVMEQGWIDMVSGTYGQRPGMDDYEGNFRLGPEETVAGLFTRFDETAAETEAVIAGIADLGQAVPVPKGVPWFPDDVDSWSVRWVLLHLIEEISRHAGHADIVRESLDGATMHPLMAAAEGWPASPWMQPWQRRAG